MSPRTGRPTTDPKDTRIEVRLSKKDKKRLKRLKNHLDCGKGEVIRLAIKLLYAVNKEDIKADRQARRDSEWYNIMEQVDIDNDMLENEYDDEDEE